MKSKRIAVVTDLHCGHYAALTPPAWHLPEDPEAGARYRLALAQRELWDWYSSTLASIKPVYAVFGLGDFIDGDGAKNGGVEELTTDRAVQCEMAVACLKEFGCKRYQLVYGTRYHGGAKEAWEAQIARDLGAPIGKHEWPSIDGVVFDLKHKIGSSQQEHLRHTALARARQHNLDWHRNGLQPKADILLRGHVHYHKVDGGQDGNPPRPWLAMTCPALQLANTIYGGLECEGMVEVGLVVFDVFPNGTWSYRHIPAPLTHNRAQAREI